VRPSLAWALILLLLPAGCAGRPDDRAAILDLLRQEAQGVVAQDLGALMALWAEDAVVTDAAHTPDDPSDDLVWRGRDAIRDRYVHLVFPGGAKEAGPLDVRIEVRGDRATAWATTHIGEEIAPGGDRWTFVRRGGRWLLESLTYNLEPPP
jgi:ketosteroid isomerase-like protein